MGQPLQIWGTVSVRDHLRPNAFVAELVLFDTLVVPRPPRGAAWPADWDAAAQDRVLGWIPPERLMEVSWEPGLRGEWEKQRAAADAQADVADLQAQPGFAAAIARRDFDAPEFHLTRRVLQDYVDEARNTRLSKNMPGAPVAVIPAYDSPRAFLDDTPDQDRLLRAFGWDFLVPSDEAADGKRRSHEDQVKAALDLAAMPEVRAHRDAFRAWTSVEALRGTTTDDARERMEALVADYARAVAATRIPVRVKWGAGIAEIAGDLATMFINPAFKLFGLAMKAGRLAADPRLDALSKMPDAVKPAGLIHAMRAEFALPDGAEPEDRPRTRIADHWPDGAPPLYL